MSLSWLTELRNTTVHNGSCPHIIIDHRKYDNPYESKYGNNWKEKIRESVLMKQYVCIRDLIQHIHDCSMEAFLSTPYDNTWYFYHDALKQKTAKSTVAWMKDKGFYKQWLIPQLGLNEGTPYASRPVGN